MASRLNGPVVAGAVALVVAGWLLWLTVQHGEEPPARLGTSSLVNRTGGYSIRVPDGMKATRQGKVTRVADRARTVLVTITPTGPGSPVRTNTAVLARMGSTYRTVDLGRSQRQTVDGRPAIASFGRATTRKGVALRFVLITVKGRAHNFALSSFAAADSDPSLVLPRVRAVVNGFHVRPR